MSDGIARFRDFTGRDERITFKVRDEVFTAIDDIPLALMGQLSKIGDEISAGTADGILTLFEKILEPESYERFQLAVQGRIIGTVIGISRIKEIIPWLLEQYGLRPTEASSGSSGTLSESGANSTDGLVLMDATS